MDETDNNYTANIEDSSAAPDKKPRSYRLLVAFIICLTISGLMWLFIELLKTYNDEVKYNIEFKNVPKGLILTNTGDSSIYIGLTSQGFELINIKYFEKRKKPLIVNLEDINIRQTAEGYVASLPTAKLIRDLNKQLDLSKSISYIRPDTLYFKFSEVHSKRIPVIPLFSFESGSQYEMGDSISISPQLVTVRSIKNVIDTIRAAYTDIVKIKIADTNKLMKVRLSKGKMPWLLKYSSDSVSLKVNLQQITEAIYSVPVQVRGEGKENVKIMPEKVDLYCRVPMAQFKNIKPEDFEVTADYKKHTSKGKLNVQVSQYPAGIKVIKTKPSELEYIILK